jgi:hypothetical protein
MGDFKQLCGIGIVCFLVDYQGDCRLHCEAHKITCEEYLAGLRLAQNRAELVQVPFEGAQQLPSRRVPQL